MRKIIFSLMLLSIGMRGFCTIWTITNSGTTFTPNAITITLGDSVNFNLANIHNVVEVSQSTWNANGNTALPGFSTPYGGGLVLPVQLTVGTHYYVCSPHASIGMKGIIIVQNSTGIIENQIQSNISIYPNPTSNLITIKSFSKMIGFQYFILDQKGSQVFNGNLVNEVTTIDISQLKPGIYLIQIVGQRKQSYRIIKD